MAIYRYKATIEAIQWTGTNYDEVCEFVGQKLEKDSHELINGEPALLILNTYKGHKMVSVSDYISKAYDGTFNINDAKIFEILYEEVPENNNSLDNDNRDYRDGIQGIHY